MVVNFGLYFWRDRRGKRKYLGLLEILECIDRLYNVNVNKWETIRTERYPANSEIISRETYLLRNSIKAVFRQKNVDVTVHRNYTIFRKVLASYIINRTVKARFLFRRHAVKIKPNYRV